MTCLAGIESIGDNLVVSESKVDVQSLSTEERLSLLVEIWDSLTPADVELTPTQSEELHRRIADMEQHPDEAIPWDEAKRRVRDRLQ